MKTLSHPWSFRQRLRPRTFGWRGSKLAIERLKEALAEIKTVARNDPETAAEGAVLLMERLWPALQAVDSSSGARGTATNKTVLELIEILLAHAGGRRALEAPTPLCLSGPLSIIFLTAPLDRVNFCAHN